MGGYLEIYAGSLARYNNAAAFINAYYAEYDILSTVQDTLSLLQDSIVPSAIGNRISGDTPFDILMTVNQAAVVVAFGEGVPWASIIFDAIILSTMIESHGHPSILYGFLTEEDFLGGFVYDALGYDEFF